MIDANANRSREGLRVLEDIARFVLSSQADAAELKSIRHELTAAIARLDPTQVGTAMRDAQGDVGRTVTTLAEGEREDLRAVARAATSRTTEALRVLEETAKVIGRGSHTFEALRYRVYDTGAALTARLVPEAPQWTLCVLVTEALCSRPWQDVVSLAIDGGADCIQLREKDLPDGVLVARATELVAIARPRGVAVVVNDRPDIALLCAADGLHLGQNDLSVADARAVVGADVVIGVSCSSVDAAQRAVADGASTLGLGAMFSTRTKDDPSVRGPELLRESLGQPAVSAVPHLAIGGITPFNAPEVVAAGARGLAVSLCVCGADDPAAVCAELVAAVRGGRNR